MSGRAKSDDYFLLTLKRSSWKNIFRVLKWVSPLAPSSSMDAYRAHTGEHWTLGNFWASIQELQRQFDEQEEEE